MFEKTGVQLFASVGNVVDGPLPNPNARNYLTYRKMRKDPTIAFARMLAVAPLAAAGWSYETTSDAPGQACELIENCLEPLRTRFVKSALEGNCDYGWQGYEMVTDVDEEGYIYVSRLKPLLQQITWILIYGQTGEYAGLRQLGPQGNPVNLSENGEAVLVSLDVEGTAWYGEPLLENSREPWDKGMTVEDAACRYDKKVAGTHWVIHYPMGVSDYNGTTDMDNFFVAKDIANRLQASGIAVIPIKLRPASDDADGEEAWKIELMSDSGSAQTAFISRLNYLDALKVRGMGLPERAVLQGQFGTKAEAEAHADFAILVMELRHVLLCQEVNKQVCNWMLKMNFGEQYEDTVFVKPVPLADQKIAVLKDIYKAICTNTDSGPVELMSIDTDALKKKLGVPVKEQPTMQDLATYPVQV